MYEQEVSFYEDPNLGVRTKRSHNWVHGSLKRHCSHHLMEQYLHNPRDTGHPVRSAIHKLEIGRLEVGWVTTSESLLLYVSCLVLYTPKS